MDKKNFQFYYGIIITAVGLGVFYRIPDVMQKVETIEFFSQKLLAVKISFYFLGAFLVMAGAMRIYKNYK